MIAIVILGIGLVMVATMFPVAWDRARDLSEYTSEVAVTEAAHATVKLVTHVNRGAPYVNDSTLTPSITPVYGSFAGDLIFDPNFKGSGNPEIISFSDTRVHQLYLENMTVARKSQPRAFLPQRNEPWNDVDAPWNQERLRDGGGPGSDLGIAVVIDCGSAKKLKSYCDWMFLSPQVRFESRVYPPMEPRPGVEPDGTISGTEPEAQLWDEAFDSVRFAWAAFHKLDEIVGPEKTGSGPSPEDFEDARTAVHDDRTFRMYYVTLRRPLPTLRYARQNTEPDSIPDPKKRDEVVVPKALPADQDVMLPVPWRVQIYFPADTIVAESDRTGIPTVVEVNTENAETAEFMVDLFPRGAMFIDEVNGQVYKVVKRRLAGDDFEQAFLTLDREVVIEDIDDGPLPFGGSNAVELVEQIRAVWVFPPPVDTLRGPEERPLFVGKHPVIGIETRVLKFPRS